MVRIPPLSIFDNGTYNNQEYKTDESTPENINKYKRALNRSVLEARNGGSFMVIVIPSSKSIDKIKSNTFLIESKVTGYFLIVVSISTVDLISLPTNAATNIPPFNIKIFLYLDIEIISTSNYIANCSFFVINNNSSFINSF